MSEIVPRRYHHFTPERQTTCLKALEMGYTRTAACAAAGIDKKTFYNWLGDSTNSTEEHDDGQKLTFAQRVDRAEARAQGAVETVLLNRIPRDPALAWRYLAQRFPEEWQSPEAIQRIVESKSRVRLTQLELRLAELEEKLLQKELEKPDGGQDESKGDAAGDSESAGSVAQEIKIEYVCISPDDSDTESA